MTAMEMARGYFAAWNARDPAKIVACFADGGTYSDPNVPDGISGPALAGYAGAMFEAFPDLSFEEGKETEASDGSITAEWVMKGTQDGPFHGLPPSGRAISVPGIDVIECSNAGITSVRGYFGSAAMMAQLDLRVAVQPKRMGPVQFGTSTYTSVGNKAKPGVIGVTQIHLTSPEQADELRGHSRAILMEIARMPGFISSQTSVSADGHGVTLTAWEDMESAKTAVQGSAHADAMKAFFDPGGLGVSAWTSLWTEGQLNTRWQRCDACEKMAVVTAEGTCKCGAALPEAPPYL